MNITNTQDQALQSLNIWKFLSKVEVLRKITKEKGYLTYEDLHQHIDASLNLDIDSVARILCQAGLQVYNAEPLTYTQSISSCDEAPAKVSSGAYDLICEQRTKPATKSQLERRRVYTQSISSGDKAPAKVEVASSAMETVPANDPLSSFSILNEHKRNIVIQQQKITALQSEIFATQTNIKTLKVRMMDVENTLNRVKQEMLEVNLRLVFSIAVQYSQRGVAFSHLIIEGKNALTKAIDEFSHHSDEEFLNYASRSIHQALSHFVANLQHSHPNPHNAVPASSSAEKSGTSIDHFNNLINFTDNLPDEECYISA